MEMVDWVFESLGDDTDIDKMAGQVSIFKFQEQSLFVSQGTLQDVTTQITSLTPFDAAHLTFSSGRW